MRPDTLLRYALALAFLTISSGWGATAFAQQSPSATSQGTESARLSVFQQKTMARGGLEVLVDQSDDFGSGLVSQTNIDTPEFDTINADDFTVPEGMIWSIQQVAAGGFYSASADNPEPAPQCTQADIGIWTSTGVTPDTPFALQEGVAPTTDTEGNLTFDITPVELPVGTYWLSVVCEGDLNFDTADDDGDAIDIRRWNWRRNDDNDADLGAGETGVLRNDGGAFGLPAVWNAYDAIGLTAGFDLNFVLSGVAMTDGGGGGDMYSFSDSNDADGPTFDWMDISGTGTALVLGDDDGVSVDLPFSFPFYGNDKSSVIVTSNGYLTFGEEDGDFSNDPIPSVDEPNDLIAVFWEDQDPGDGVGTAYWQDMGDGRFVVQYEMFPPWPGPGDGTENYTYQAVLYQNGDILFQYLTMDGAVDGATVGVENADGTGGLQIAFNEAYVENSLAVLITSGGGTGGGDQVSFPITFEDENVDYELVDFPDDGSGPASTIVVDPEDAENMAVQSVYPAEPACFAGTTVANATGFDMPIPFAEGETFLNVRVWSPEAGVRVRLKVEKFDDPTISVESDEFTTVAMGWETLEYDFTDQVPGTAAINFDSEYTKASIFFGFSCGVDPSASGGNTYYWDDLAFGPADMGGDMTIAEARAAGPGTTVTVTGVVTRAEGDFAYIQDDSAALTLRQTEGDFFDDVADGTIDMGTEVTVTGTLSEFRGLLQINEGDLTSYTVNSDDNELPEAQEISIQDLIDNGEDYEAELVQIDDLTTPSMGTFAASTNYDVTDETATGILRVPNADDSNVDGTDIPDGEFTFTGVVGQFTFADPANDGYQLLAIEETDIEGQEPDGAISFDPNPLIESLEVGETGVETVTVTNNTDADVAYDFSQYSGDAPPPPQIVHEALDLAKGERDPRTGNSALRGAGGPDVFGYRWIDSNEPGGPTYSFVDISGTGTALTLGDDEGAVVALPFDFSYYGEDQSEVTITSNGYLTFGGDDGDFSNDPIPTADEPNNMIAPFWEDQDPGDGVGQVLYQDMGDGRFIVQYQDNPPWPGPGEGLEYTYQVILYSNGNIVFQYESMEAAVDGATVGIENGDGTDGLQIAFNEAYVEDGLAVLISVRPQFVTAVSPATGTIPAGGSVDVDVTFDATGLIGGTYEGNLVVETDLEADPSTFELPVVLVVTGMAECMLTLDGDFEDTIVGNTASITATVMNGGTDTCDLTDATADGPFSVEGFEATTLNPGASYSFTVVFTPTEAGDAEGTLTVSTEGEDLTADLSATGQDAPTPELSDTSFEFTVPVGGQDSDSFTISNVGGEDAADLEYSISVVASAPLTGNGGETGVRPTLRGTRDARQSSASRFGEQIARADGSVRTRSWELPDHGPMTLFNRGGVTITHSVSQEIVPLTGIACSAGGLTDQNSYWRVFDLDEFALDGGIDVVSVDIGVETSFPTATTVRLYELDGAFTVANLTLVGEATYNLDGTEAPGIITVPVTGSVGGGGTLVVEWDVPNLQDVGGSVFFGANSAGQTGPVYVSAEACALTEPTDLGSIGFPDAHWVLNVNGEAGTSLVSVDPESGSIDNGDSDEITINVDATDIDPGTYEFELLIETNDPNTPTLTVDVTVNVTGTPSNEDGAIPTEFVIDQNYPNPFASATTIKYGLPQAERVTIDVYDAVGRHVATLVDQDKTAGYHEARWNASSVASGLYVYRIQAGANTRTMKMVVVR